MSFTLVKAILVSISKNKPAKASKITRDSYLYPFAEDAKNATLLPLVTNWSKIDKVYMEYMNKIFEGELSAKDGLDRAAAEIDTLLANSN